MKNLGLTLMIVLFTVLSFGQVIQSSGVDTAGKGKSTGVMDPVRPPVDGVYKKIHINKYTPMGYAPLREADVMWSQLIWSVIDLREKMNHPLYFPTDSKGNWKSLMQAILDATTDTSEANPSPLRVYDDEYVSIPYTVQGIKANMGNTNVVPIVDDYGEETGQKIVFIPWGAKEVYQYILKDQYFIDKQRSVEEPRLMVVCPMFWYVSTATYQSSGDQESDMGAVGGRKWRKFGFMYFPEMRKMLATTEVFNPQNNAQRRTYDDVFMQRHFSSFIKAEENVHDNRGIDEYIVNGMDQRLEADRIKETIRVREHEMWEY